jgi:L-rhamnose isomerase / sugar isomerase
MSFKAGSYEIQRLMNSTQIEQVFSALDSFRIEVPSWGFADTGTRFGKFFQEAAAIDLNDKLADAGQVHALTGCCPTVAVHVQWDFEAGADPAAVAKLARKHGVAIGSINPNLFQDQQYKYGSFGHASAAIRQQALQHVFDCIEIANKVESRIISLWFADGTNYPGQDSIRERKHRFEACLKAAHDRLAKDHILLVEYKPFEPAFYHTDIGDWGMAYILAKKAGPQAKVLVDTGHHYLSQNIEQIVACLLDENMLGGFHFNDRRYADDDLTLGSIDPYQVFRIFAEIHAWTSDTGCRPDIAYMIDQSHNLKPKIEAMIQTVVTAQELCAKAASIDFAKLKELQSGYRIVDSEELLKEAFKADVRHTIREWRRKQGLPGNPLAAHRKSGYEKRAAADRSRRRKAGAQSAAKSAGTFSGR